MIDLYSIPPQMMLSLRGGGYVDLGLPSGLKWAKCNVGAETETDYGYYFQWGDIEDKSKSDCSWQSYKYGDGSNKTLTKYIYSSFGSYDENPDNKFTLDLEDDAARVHMGGVWRMPTSSEFQELIDNTTNAWVTINGVSGRKFTSRADTSKYIFFPAAGHRSGSSFFRQGSDGDIWSSSLSDISPRAAFYLGFGPSGGRMYTENRDYGLSVRGVCK